MGGSAVRNTIQTVPSTAIWFTVTNDHCRSTNSTSTKYPSFHQAEKEAIARVADGRALGVYILKPVSYVCMRPKPEPPATLLKFGNYSFA